MTNRNELERLQPMTTEEKALAGSPRFNEQVYRELALRYQAERDAAIEAHEADKKAFSDAVKALIETGKAYEKTRDAQKGPEFYAHCKSVDALRKFILPEPEPDPLVEAEDPIDALVDLLAPVLTHSQGMAARERENRFRNAMAAIMTKIERIEQ